jgi:PAS domain S-box-containing protein
MYSELSILFEHSSDVFCQCDDSGRIVSGNASFRRILGYEQESWPSLNINHLFAHQAEKNRNKLQLDSIYAGKILQDFESRVRTRDGRYLNMTWSAAYDQEQKLISAIGVVKKDEVLSSLQADISEKIYRVIQRFNEGFLLLNNRWQMTLFNPALLAITGMKIDEMYNTDFRYLDQLGINSAEIISAVESAFLSQKSAHIHHHDPKLNRWLRINIFPNGHQEVVLLIRDITNLKVPELILSLEKRVLELNADPRYTVAQTADLLLQGIEAIFPEMICSIIEVDDDQQYMRHIAGPRLPAAYIEKIDGLQIGPNVGSCGSSAYFQKQVIVSDIEFDPVWADYKQLILPYGIKACWSTPVINSGNQKVLAVFGIYYKTSRNPTSEELEIIARTVNILRVVIEFKRSIAHINDQNNRLLEIATISSHGLRKPVATILGLVNLFDKANLNNPLNAEIIEHLETSSLELDDVIHHIVEKTTEI